MNIGTFAEAALGTLVVPPEVEMVHTSGYGEAGDGGEATFVHSATEPDTIARFQAADERWFAISPNQLLRPEMFGAPAGTGDSSPAILAALALAGGAGVQLGPRAYGIGGTVTVPASKYFRGSGLGQTTLVALPTMSTGVSTPPVLQCAPEARGVEISGFTLDGAHVGHPLGGGGGAVLDRVHGICPSGIDFLVENVRVHDVWGYGIWATGAGSSGTVRHCRSENCNVLFEATGPCRVLLEDCHGLTAPDTITCEAGFHAVPDVIEMVVSNSSYEGHAPAVSAVALTADQTMRFVAFRARTTGPYPAVVTAGPSANSLFFDGCNVVAVEGNCLNPGAGTVIHASNSRFSGWNVGIHLKIGSVGHFSGCHAVATTSGGAVSYALVAQGWGYWTGGSLDTSANPAGIAYAGNAVISRTTQISPLVGGQMIIQELSGTFPLGNKFGTGPYGYFQLIPVPRNISNGAKWSMYLTLIAGPASPTPMHAVLTPKWIGGRTIRVDGASTVDLSGEIVAYDFKEWA